MQLEPLQYLLIGIGTIMLGVIIYNLYKLFTDK
jgi:hypothetical protein